MYKLWDYASVNNDFNLLESVRDDGFKEWEVSGHWWSMYKRYYWMCAMMDGGAQGLGYRSR